MDDKAKAPGNLPGNQGQPGTDATTGSQKPPVEHDAGGDTPAHNPAPHETESSETNPGAHQTQAGMRS